MCILQTEDNGIEYVTNNCIKFKKVREELIEKFNKLDTNTRNITLLEIIEYYYYSKKLFKSKDEKENDNNEIKLIKEFIKNMHYTYRKNLIKKIIKLILKIKNINQIMNMKLMQLLM